MKTEKEKEDYLGNITLAMRMKVAAALSATDAPEEAPEDAPEAAPEEAEEAPEEPKEEPKEGPAAKKGKKAAKDPKEAEPKKRPAPAPAAASSSAPEAKKARRPTAVEKHMEELKKLKTEKQKEKYISNLTPSMQIKVASAISEAEAAQAAQAAQSAQSASEAPKEAEAKAASPAKVASPKAAKCEKHLEELSKIKTEKARTAYLNKLPAAMRKKVEAASASPRRLGPATLLEVAQQVVAARQGDAEPADKPEAKPAKKKQTAVMKHLEELNKLKNPQKKESYLNKLPVAMRTKMAEAMSLAGGGC
ncbi:unnamed protein product [Effrenium voratum]|nr:unnamed protein product [Effrenium voratum]